MRSFCSWLSNKKSWKPHSGLRTKGTQKKKSFHSYPSPSADDSQIISSIPELFSAFQAGFLTPSWKSLCEASKDISNLFSLSLPPKLVLLLFFLAPKTTLPFTLVPKSETYNFLLILFLYHFKLSHHQVLSLLPST